MPPTAEQIVNRVMEAFPGVGEHKRPSVAEVERVMRPFGVVSAETQDQVKTLLCERGKTVIDYRIGSWMEANFVCGGEDGPRKEHAIQWLLSDVCTCTLAHLKTAIAHSSRAVDPRILDLLNHEYFQK